MNHPYVRELIDNYGRSTLIQASRLFNEGISAEAIVGDLLLNADDVQDCIFAGAYLQAIADEQQRFQDAIVEPYADTF